MTSRMVVLGWEPAEEEVHRGAQTTRLFLVFNKRGKIKAEKSSVCV